MIKELWEKVRRRVEQSDSHDMYSVRKAHAQPACPRPATSHSIKFLCNLITFLFLQSNLIDHTAVISLIFTPNLPQAVDKMSGGRARPTRRNSLLSRPPISIDDIPLFNSEEEVTQPPPLCTPGSPDGVSDVIMVDVDLEEGELRGWTPQHWHNNSSLTNRLEQSTSLEITVAEIKVAKDSEVQQVEHVEHVEHVEYVGSKTIESSFEDNIESGSSNRRTPLPSSRRLPAGDSSDGEQSLPRLPSPDENQLVIQRRRRERSANPYPRPPQAGSRQHQTDLRDVATTAVPLGEYVDMDGKYKYCERCKLTFVVGDEGFLAAKTHPTHFFVNRLHKGCLRTMIVFIDSISDADDPNIKSPAIGVDFGPGSIYSFGTILDVPGPLTNIWAAVRALQMVFRGVLDYQAIIDDTDGPGPDRAHGILRTHLIIATRSRLIVDSIYKIGVELARRPVCRGDNRGGVQVAFALHKLAEENERLEAQDIQVNALLVQPRFLAKARMLARKALVKGTRMPSNFEAPEWK
jgi:hypothetical protein